MRNISEAEMKHVNPMIIERLGTDCLITSGTVETLSGQRRIHISTLSFKEFSEGTLKKIGEILKKQLGADEVFYYGIKIG